MKSALLRPAMIVAPLVLGVLIPQAAGLSFLVRWLLVGMLFMVCLRLDLRDFRPCAAHWRLLAANLAVGVVAFLLLRGAGFGELAEAAFFTGISPTATAAPVVMSFLRGRVGFVASGFVVTNVGVSLALLVLIPTVTGNFSIAFAGDVLKNMLIVMALPFLLASAVRRLHPAASQWPVRCRMFTFSAWSLMLFIVASGAAGFLRNNADISGLVVVGIAAFSAAICALNFVLGGLVVPKRFRREGSQTLGQKNTMLSLYLAMTFASPLAALGPTFYVIFHNLWNAWQLFVFDRLRRRRGSSVRR